MDLAFDTRELEVICTSRDGMPLSWGKGRDDVRRSLTMTAYAETLADLQEFRCLRTTMLDAADGPQALMIEHGAAKLYSQAFDSRGRLLLGGKRLDAASVRALLLTAIDCNGQLVGEALAS